MPLVLRDDDINPSSNYANIIRTYNVIKSIYKDSTIIPCVTLFSRYNKNGSVYEEVPFKNQPTNWFYNVDKFMLEYEYVAKENIASHGLFHVNHAKLSKDAQSMSILGSCHFLKTNMFCAPFNAFNQDTIDICVDNSINLINKTYPWKSLEHEEFNPNHKYWYFHSWRFSSQDVKRKLEKCKAQ